MVFSADNRVLINLFAIRHCIVGPEFC